MERSSPIPNRGHREQDFVVLRLTNMPAIFVETAFISNSSDTSLLRNRQYDFESTIANQIVNTFGTPVLNMKEVLRFGGTHGLFKDTQLEFEALNVKTPVAMVSLVPPITVHAELSLKSTLGTSNKYINLTGNADTIGTEFVNELTKAGVTFDFTKKDLGFSLNGLAASVEIDKLFKYEVKVLPNNSIEVSLETSIKYDQNNKIYQKIVITFYRSQLQNGRVCISVPIATDNYEKVSDKNIVYDIVYGAIAVGAVAVATYASSVTLNPAPITAVLAFFIYKE